MPRALVCVLAILVGGFADASELTVRVAPTPGAAGCLANAAVLALPDNGGATVRHAITSPPGQLTLDLNEDEGWRLTAEGDGCWSETLTLWRPFPREIVLRVYRVATVRGAFSLAGKERPTEVHGHLFSQRPGSEPLEGGLQCALRNLVWECAVPAALPFDLRLEMPGFATAYYWDVVAKPGLSSELEARAVYAGASIAGWVHDPADKPVDQARVVLMPLEAVPQAGHGDARRSNAVTNRRGFFQFAGLDGGQYRLVAESSSFSPSVGPEIAVRRGEATTLSRPLRYSAFGELQVVLDPPVDTDGPWIVALTEAVPLYLVPRQPIVHAADRLGHWSASRLRADLYELVVQNGPGSVVHRAAVDFFGGGSKSINLSIARIPLRGVLRFADEPLKAEIEFRNASGKLVRTTTDEFGRFETRFTTPGWWSPTVLYGVGRSKARIELAGIAVKEPAAAPQEVEITLPGGRIRGSVVSRAGAPMQAAVHATRTRQPDGQQITSETGEFDLVGLRPGTYQLDAQGASGGTSQPITVLLEEGETKSVKLVVDPYNLVAGFVLTPEGAPASGAIVRICDDGVSWTREVTDVRGYFEHSVNASIPTVKLVILTYSYPSAMVTIPATGEPVTLRLQPAGGLLRIRGVPTAMVSSRETAAPIQVFFFPEPFGRFNGAIYLEPGNYQVCPPAQERLACRDVVINGGAEQIIDFKATGERR